MAFDFSQMQDWMVQARRQYEALQQKMAGISVETATGAGLVRVRMNGQKIVLELYLDPETARTDPEMLADLARAAINDASRRVDEQMQRELGGLAGSLLPPGMANFS